MTARAILLGVSACVALTLVIACTTGLRQPWARKDAVRERPEVEAAARGIFGSAISGARFDIGREGRPHVALMLNRPVEPRVVFEMLAWFERRGQPTNGASIETLWPLPDGKGDLRHYIWNPGDSKTEGSLTFLQGQTSGLTWGELIPLTEISVVRPASAEVVDAVAEGKVPVPTGFVKSTPAADPSTTTPPGSR